RVGEFQAAFDAVAAAVLDPATLEATPDSDGALAPHEFDRLHAEALRDGGPWGQGFPEPLFDGEFAVADWRVGGERHLRMTLRAEGVARPLPALHFGGWRGDAPPSRARPGYRLQPDDYRGGDAVQLVVEDLEACWAAGGCRGVVRRLIIERVGHAPPFHATRNPPCVPGQPRCSSRCSPLPPLPLPPRRRAWPWARRCAARS